MPGIVEVRVIAARDLPIMDRSSELTDAFVELRLGEAFHRTRVCPKTLNPTWDSKWFKFNVSDEDLQDEPLQIKLMDHDIYTAHDAIGRVYIHLNLLTNGGQQATNLIDGWFPIYDTLHGIRGQVHLIVKVELIRDEHRFKQSSCGVMLFACPAVPVCYDAQSIHGFVEELVVNDDPEYQWIDKIRTPRASNEARQRLFVQLSGELQRKIGLKTLEAGGNAVVGYKQCFDLEGESGIVVRGIGTCVKLIPKLSPLGSGPPLVAVVQLPTGVKQRQVTGEREEMIMVNPMSVLISPQHYSEKISLSDSDGPPSPTKTADTLVALGDVMPSVSSGSVAPHASAAIVSFPEIMSSSEFPFYTLSVLPPGILSNIGGVVSAHSVKLLDKINNPDEPETRDVWWREVRNEVRQHALAMNCNTVMGYSESTSICDNLCVFSAFGTAVSVFPLPQQLTSKVSTSPGSSNDTHPSILPEEESGKEQASASHEAPSDKHPHCRASHTPYSITDPPLGGSFSTCRVCSAEKVPTLLFSTCEVPSSLWVRGRGTLIQARAVLHKKKCKGDDNAQEVGKNLPFLESKLHRRLLCKLRVKGMNALFQFRMLLNIGDTVILGTAMGTAVYLEALPSPSKLVLSCKDSATDPRQLEEYQTVLTKTQEQNKTLYEVDYRWDLHLPADPADIDATRSKESQMVVTGGEGLGGTVGVKSSDINLSSSAQDALVLTFEDHLISEEDLYYVNADRPLPIGFHVSNTLAVPGIPMDSARGQTKMVTTVAKSILDSPKQSSNIERQFADMFNVLLQMVAFKARHMSPCTITNITYDIDIPEDNELQVAVTAMVTSLKSTDGADWQSTLKPSQSDEMIFNMEEYYPLKMTTQHEAEVTKHKVVQVSSLPFVSGYHVNHYLGIINLFLIKESTSVNEVNGMDSFMHLFLLEALSIARAHVAALGGNALLSYRLSELVLIEHPQKNQAQCLLNLSGDAVELHSVSSSSSRAIFNPSLLHHSSSQPRDLQAVQQSPIPDLHPTTAGCNNNPLPLSNKTKRDSEYNKQTHLTSFPYSDITGRQSTVKSTFKVTAL